MATEISRADPNRTFIIVDGIMVEIPTPPGDEIGTLQIVTEEFSPSGTSYIIVDGIMIELGTGGSSEESAPAPSKIEQSDPGYA